MEDFERLAADLTSGREERAEAAVRELAALGPAALPSLRAWLSDLDPDLRWWSTRALAEIEDPEVPALLRAALQDSDPGVRQCAALALRQRPAPQAVPDLVALLSGADRLLARLSGDALAAAGKDAVPALLEVLQTGSQAARVEAARALALIGDTSSIPALFTALDDDSAMIVHWASEGLERMGVGMSFFKL